MTNEQAEAMLKSLQRIESFLEAIDWKVWNFHKLIIRTEDGVEPTAPVEQEEFDTQELAAVIETPKVSQATKPAAPKYPSIEKWS
jgi:hypothetical protein